MDNQATIATAKADSRAKDFFDLLKPRVMSLVVFTGLCAMAIAPGFETTHPLISIVALICLAFGAGAAGAFNMWYEHRLDAKMKRTKNRPIPAGRIDPDDALGFAIFVSIFSIMFMGLAVNWVAASILGFANVFYSVFYTMFLKPNTAQNIVIGGAAGAFPPMIGWAAITGNVSLFPILLFLIIFLWTPPHFWALALFSNEDYKKANIPMLPVTKGERHTKWQMFIYTLILAAVSISPSFLGYTGMLYGITAVILNGLFILSSIRVLQEKQGYKQAKLMFGYSILYLFAIFTALVFDFWL